MSDADQKIISAAAVKRLLTAFDVHLDDRDVADSRRDDGSLGYEDLCAVLTGSRCVLDVDWRTPLAGAADDVIHLLARVRIAAEVDVNDEENEATFEIGGCQQSARFGGEGADDFDEVVRVVNRLIVGAAEFRRFCSSIGSDGWQYALLSCQSWAALDDSIPEHLALLFARP